jgi:hypothetical protein
MRSPEGFPRMGRSPASAGVIVAVLATVLLVGSASAGSISSAKTFRAPFRAKPTTETYLDLGGCGAKSAKVTTTAVVNLTTGAFAFGGRSSAKSCPGQPVAASGIWGAGVGMSGPTFSVASGGSYHLISNLTLSGNLSDSTVFKSASLRVQAIASIWVTSYLYDEATKSYLYAATPVIYPVQNDSFDWTGSYSSTLSNRMVSFYDNQTLSAGVVYVWVTMVTAEAYAYAATEGSARASVSVTGSFVADWIS